MLWSGLALCEAQNQQEKTGGNLAGSRRPDKSLRIASSARLKKQKEIHVVM
jgi:hypothetical protein